VDGGGKKKINSEPNWEDGWVGNVLVYMYMEGWKLEYWAAVILGEMGARSLHYYLFSNLENPPGK
jgi:hypothetical protein